MNPRHCRHLAPAAALLTALMFTLDPPAAVAQCPWDVGGKWVMVQGKHHIALDLQQKGNVITGTAKYGVTTLDGGGLLFKGSLHEQVLTGSVDGTLEGDNFDVQIYWPEGVVGVYQGKVGPRGRLEGRTYDRNKRSSTATWYSSTLMKCAETKRPGPALAPRSGKPVARTSGRSNPATGADPVAAPQQPRADGPQISARPNLVTIPAGATQGACTITWDGGADHPYAEVWVKVDDGAETFVVEQGKGSRTVTVERGKRYLYMLTDSGQRLATTTVTAK